MSKCIVMPGLPGCAVLANLSRHKNSFGHIREYSGKHGCQSNGCGCAKSDITELCDG